MYKWRILNRFKTFIINMIIIIIINLKLEHVFSNKMIIYKNEVIFSTFNVIVIEFNDVFANFKSIIDLSKK